MDDVPQDDLADLIVRLRGDRTQEQFAERVGLSPAMIGHVEARRRNLGLPSIEKIARALDLSDVEHNRLRRARDAFAAASSRRAGDDRPDEVAQLREQVATLLTMAQALDRDVETLGAEIVRLGGTFDRAVRPTG